MSSTTADAAAPSGAAAPNEREERRVSLFVLCLLAFGVGIFTGVGAVALRSLIGLIDNAMFDAVHAGRAPPMSSASSQSARSPTRRSTNTRTERRP